MHPQLLAVMQAPLPASAKALWSHLYAYTNGTLNIVVPLAGLLEELGVAESTLRRNRSILTAAGALESWYAAGEDGATVLHCELRSPTARAVGDRDEPVTPVTAPPRAVGARALGDRDERDDAQRHPPAPPSTELVNINQQQQQELTCCCSGGGAGEPDPAAAELLGAAGIAPHIVAELAGLGFETVARHVAAWQAARIGRDPVGVGALVKRLRTWAVPENLTAAQLTAGLLADRVTPADLAAWGIRRPPDAGYVPAGYEHIIQH